MAYWTPEEMEEVWTRYIAGETYAEISRATGKTRGMLSSVLERLRAARPERPPEKWSAADDRLVWKRYMAGVRFEEIAAELGRTKSQIANRVNTLRTKKNKTRPELWTPALDDTVWFRYLAGETAQEIATSLGMTLFQVKNRWYTLQQERGFRPRRDVSAYDAVILARYCDGIKLREIAAEIGAKETFVKTRLTLLRQSAIDMPPRRRGSDTDLSPFDVNVIRILIESGETQQQIADKFGCSREAVAAINTRRQHPDVPDYLEILQTPSAENAAQER